MANFLGRDAVYNKTKSAKSEAVLVKTLILLTHGERSSACVSAAVSSRVHYDAQHTGVVSSVAIMYVAWVGHDYLHLWQRFQSVRSSQLTIAADI